MLERFLNPSVLAGISNLELVAKTVVDGFVSGLHRSPDFGFSQEFAEYRSYTQGDDLRHVDWNVYARTEKIVLKRFRGETNSQVTVILDASASMGFASTGVSKMDYARFLTASMLYMANLQRDAYGVIVFDDAIRHYVQPSSRQGQLHRVLHALEKAVPAARTDYAKPFFHFQQFHRRRGITAVVSDFWESPKKIVETIAPLRFHGNDVVMFHLLDPQELRPKFRDSVLLVDSETQRTVEVTPDYVRNEYGPKIDAHIAELKSEAQSNGIDYCQIMTDAPLDAALREYLTLRKGRN